MIYSKDTRFVRCNQCMAIWAEQQLLVSFQEIEEQCPNCKDVSEGYLMDLPEIQVSSQ